MKFRENAETLLAKADEDLFVLRAFVTEARATDGVWGFHAQQAVEKALKAWLSAHEVNYPFTHQISDLFSLCQEHGFELNESYLELIDLTSYAMELRYGGMGPETDSLDRPRLLTLTADLWTLVRKSF